jgi:hypothetical protein
VAGASEHLNAEVAEELRRSAEERKERERRTELLEIIEVLLLATVAVATAWSGYRRQGGTATRPCCTRRRRATGATPRRPT